jgi:hypothetical protein
MTTLVLMAAFFTGKMMSPTLAIAGIYAGCVGMTMRWAFVLVCIASVGSEYVIAKASLTRTIEPLLLIIGVAAGLTWYVIGLGVRALVRRYRAA